MSLLVARRARYALELVDASEGELKRGTVYVTLSRMEEKGLLEGETEVDAEPHPGLPRRLYRVTALGKRMLEAERAFVLALGKGKARA